MTLLVYKFRDIILYFYAQSWLNACKEKIALIMFSCILQITLAIANIQPGSKWLTNIRLVGSTGGL